MGAMISIAFDHLQVTSIEIGELAQGIQGIVSDALNDKDVFVYTNSAPVSAAVEPIEVFVQVNKQKVSEPDALTQTIAKHIADWKKEAKFNHPINLNIIPVEWHSKTGI